MASIVMATSMYMLFRATSRTACLFDWSLAGFFFTVYSLLSLTGAVVHAPYILAPVLANTLYIAGHFAIAIGLRRNLGLPGGYNFLFIISIIIISLHYLPFTKATVAHRLILFIPIVMVVNFYIISIIYRIPPGKHKRAYLPLMVTEFLFAVQMIVRSALMLFIDHENFNFIGNDLLQSSGALIVLCFIIVTPMVCALIVVRRQELALRTAALTDNLTGWFNRRALQSMATEEFERCLRKKIPFQFLIFDIDHFKTINDEHGHATGDAAIRHVVGLAIEALRSTDAAFRIGGEEFAVMITGADGNVAAPAVAERLRQRIELNPLPQQLNKIKITVSVGLASSHPCDTTWEEVLNRADAALYHSKRTGRNRLSVYDEHVKTALP